jgi:hypothetical protein
MNLKPKSFCFSHFWVKKGKEEGIVFAGVKITLFNLITVKKKNALLAVNAHMYV